MPEIHWPGYNYLGPFTKSKKPINKLDEAAMEHDFYYEKHKDTKSRHKSDLILENIAKDIYKNPETSLGEKTAAFATSNTMKGKEFLEPIHCHKCKKKTKYFKPIKVQTANGLWRISTQYLKCKTNKKQYKLNIAKELHKPVRSRFPKNKIKTHGIDDLWVADLVLMRNYGDENSGYLYMLNVVDTFSKFAWSESLKKKDGENVTKSFEEIINRAKLQEHNSPTLLHTDKETEFVNTQFKEMSTKKI
ncbi:Ribonuclease H-like domain,Integrase, catalytic core,Parvovirus coat protein VP1, N-terminal [Cinara cedri]|uniref:Ribonuclease H-like domain,Integrase, catalytic core,Parvovirus coat protein VP1, N-terminal n=1 Tax=Cinara cedri TaxID=506608 RepID=A0A5E4MJ49_9HEMI|nr:Ribonuclease H-like domain,Integrase, catalytic core,Parvovirus coat protein VP1, N-terminal [Cinara cedri]